MCVQSQGEREGEFVGRVTRERERLTEGGDVREKGGRVFVLFFVLFVCLFCCCFVVVLGGRRVAAKSCTLRWGGGGGESCTLRWGWGAQWGRTDTERRRESGREKEPFSKHVRILCKSFLS